MGSDRMSLIDVGILKNEKKEFIHKLTQSLDKRAVSLFSGGVQEQRSWRISWQLRFNPFPRPIGD